MRMGLQNVNDLLKLASQMPSPRSLKPLYPRGKCRYNYGRDYSTVDGRSKRKCYWPRESCDCGRLQIGDVTREVEFLSNDDTNPNTNPKILTTRALTLADHHDAFESGRAFCKIPFPGTPNSR